MNSLAGKTLGRYYLLEQIGLGGMATVYKGLDLDHDKKVAVKVLSPHLAQHAQFRARFVREVKLLRTLQHPNIVPILDFGSDEAGAFIVMPFFPSGTLQERLQKGPLTPREGARLIDQLSAALQFAHDKGVVHRDVKPSNVLLDEQGNALLSDFGFAQVTDATLSLTGAALVGTPAYMSPEQCRGDPVDARSDQYSLGVILHQFTTGKLPFEADTPMGLVVKHVNVPLPPPRLVSPNLPEGVEAVLVKSLAKEPDHRFASVAEMNRTFQRALVNAFDATGRLKPPPTVLPTRASQQMTRPPKTQQAGTGTTPWFRRRAAVAAALIALFACLPGAWVVAQGGVPLGVAGMEVSLTATPTPVDLMATIVHLSTEIAGSQGEGMDADQVGTAVAGTLQAAAASLPLEIVQPESTATPTSDTPGTAAGVEPSLPARSPTRTSGSGSGGSGGPLTATPTGTRTPTPTLTGGPPATDLPATPTPTSPPTASGTQAPTETRTPTSAPAATSTQAPTATIAPTATRTAPPPTATCDGPPGQCKKTPSATPQP